MYILILDIFALYDLRFFLRSSRGGWMHSDPSCLVFGIQERTYHHFLSCQLS